MIRKKPQQKSIREQLVSWLKGTGERATTAALAERFATTPTTVVLELSGAAQQGEPIVWVKRQTWGPDGVAQAFREWRHTNPTPDLTPAVEAIVIRSDCVNPKCAASGWYQSPTTRGPRAYICDLCGALQQ